MRKLLLLSAASGVAALCFAVGSAQALPMPGGISAKSTSNVEQIRYKTVCDRRGRHCHNVWVDEGRGRRDMDRDRDRRR